jgi:amidase
MRPDEYMDFDGVGLAELVRGGDVTAAALAEAAIARIESVDKSINAVVERAYPAAREAG